MGRPRSTRESQTVQLELASRTRWEFQGQEHCYLLSLTRYLRRLSRQWKLICVPGWHHYHLLPPAPLSPLQAPPASSYCRSPGRNHSGSIRDDAHPWLPECHLPHCCEPEPQSGSQPRAYIIPLPCRPRSQYANVFVKLEGSAQCGSGWNDLALRSGLCYCLGTIPRIP